MKIFIVGATGVLGRALLPLLLQHGHTVRALVRSQEKAQTLAQMGIETVQGDLLAQGIEPHLSDMMQGCHASLHLATAIPRDPTVPGAWDATTRLRTEGTRILLQSALAADVKRYVQQSIVMAYPDGGDLWLDETAPLDASPQRAAISGPVIAMEDMVRAVTTEQMSWSILRGGYFVGPGTAQATQIESLRAGEMTIPCDGHNFLSLINVADMAMAVLIAAQAAPAGSIFNIVDEPIRNGDYLNRLATLVGAPQPRYDPAQPCPPSQRCSNDAARTLLRWTPTHGIWPTHREIG